MFKFAHLNCLALAGLCALSATPSANAQLVATYQFNNTLAADQPGAPTLTALNLGSFVTDNSVLGQSRTVYQRTSASSAPSAQSALRLDTTALTLPTHNYAVELVFTFTDNLNGSSYRRIVNSYDPSSQSDNGFYVGPEQNLNIFNFGSNSGGPGLTNGIYYDVVLSVSASGERAYLNGALANNYGGGTPDAIQSHYLSFFLDDGSEYGNGKLALLRVFDQALTDAEVAALYNNGNPFPTANVAEPGTLALLLAGLVTLRRRCQKSRGVA